MQFKAAIVAVLTAAGILLATVQSACGAEKLISVGTGAITGVYYPLGGAICRLVNAGRRDHGHRCMVESTGGSVYNINAVMSGELDLGFAQSDAQYTALKGMGPFKDKPQLRLRALFSVYPELFTVVARQDANIKSIADLKGKRVNIGDPGSATRATTELVLNAYGIKPQELKLAAEIKSAELASALCENRIDAFAVIVGHPNANVQEATNTCASNIAAVAGPVIDQMIKDHPFFGKASMPGRMYKGTNQAQATFGVFATVVASADLPEPTAYLATKAVFDNFEELKLLHPAVANITKESMLVGNTVPFHPGAIRYFRELGLMK
ncbi:MAG: TAXI family TRAP transporter solute-binding subunit [Betaproteobacteria bacterium]|nr:TAXI family TRAP transporter solute-binding subunit [Betaproteobacteria bacterium]